MEGQHNVVGCGWSRHSGNRCDDESAVKRSCSNDSTVVRPTSVYWRSTCWHEDLHTERYGMKIFETLNIRIKLVVMSIEPTSLGCVGSRLEVEVRSQDWQGCCEVAEGWMPVR